MWLDGTDGPGIISPRSEKLERHREEQTKRRENLGLPPAKLPESDGSPPARLIGAQPTGYPAPEATRDARPAHSVEKLSKFQSTIGAYGGRHRRRKGGGNADEASAKDSPSPDRETLGRSGSQQRRKRLGFSEGN